MTGIFYRITVAAFFALAGLAPLAAQQAHVNLDWNPQKNTQNLVPYSANAISPEVDDKGMVTFRVRAPKAQEIALSAPTIGAAMGTGNKPVPFTKALDGRAKDSCFDCHSVMEGMSIPFKNDIHYKNGISCADCHGGDPNSDDQNISMSAQRGFKVRVTRQEVSAYCGRCHSDAAFMKKRNPKLRVDQAALFDKSIHAGKPAGSDTLAANCIDCHGIHNIRAVSDDKSAVAPAKLADTCGKCHADSAGMYKKSAHAAVFVTSEMGSCGTCHSSHATARVSGDMLAGGRAVCAKCHEPDTKGGKAAASMGRAFENGRSALFEAMSARGEAGPGNAVPGAAPGARGGARGAFYNQRFKKAVSMVHSLDAAAVKAAIEAELKQP